MATDVSLTRESPGAQLNAILAGQRIFLENVFSLMRSLEAEMTKRGWDLVKNGGYGVTRNGRGTGLTNFAAADWVLTEMAVAFVRSGHLKAVRGATMTPAPADGPLNVLAFQVRWLDKSPEEPVVWRVALAVEARETADPKTKWKWEDWQRYVLNRLEPDARLENTISGPIRPVKYGGSGDTLLVTGSFSAVPVTAITSQADVVTSLIEPAIADFPV